MSTADGDPTSSTSTRTMPDGTASLIAVAGFSFALLGFVTMAGIAVALGVSPPNEFWLLGTSIAGVLTGILVPPTKAKQIEQDQRAAIAQLPPQEQIAQLNALAANAAPAGAPAAPVNPGPAANPEAVANPQAMPNPVPAAAGGPGKTGWEVLDKWIRDGAAATPARPEHPAPPENQAPPESQANAPNPAPPRSLVDRITPSDWRLAILGGLFVVSGGIGLWFLNAPYQGSTQLFAVAGASGATALGILVPSPKLKSSG